MVDEFNTTVFLIPQCYVIVVAVVSVTVQLNGN